MNNQIKCLDLETNGNCTLGNSCSICTSEKSIEKESVSKNDENITFNVNAKTYVPKNKTNTNSDTNKQSDEKLSFNLGATEYVPGQKNNQLEQQYVNDEEENDDDDNEEPAGEEFDMIMKDIIKNEILEEIEDDESDDEKWFPKFKDCECCKGFVYKCTGTACSNMGECYCKMKEECDDDEN